MWVNEWKIGPLIHSWARCIGLEHWALHQIVTVSHIAYLISLASHQTFKEFGTFISAKQTHFQAFAVLWLKPAKFLCQWTFCMITTESISFDNDDLYCYFYYYYYYCYCDCSYVCLYCIPFTNLCVVHLSTVGCESAWCMCSTIDIQSAYTHTHTRSPMQRIRHMCDCKNTKRLLLLSRVFRAYAFIYLFFLGTI